VSTFGSRLDPSQDQPPVLVTRRHRRLTERELEQAVVMALDLDQGLIQAADRFEVTPSDLHRVCLSRPDLAPLPRVDRSRRPLLDRDQAEAARDRARLVGTKATARELGIGASTLRTTWHRLGIERPGHPSWRVAHPNARALTEEQAIAALKRALEVGRDRVAAELGCTPWTVTANWRYWGIQGPGRKHAATIRWRRVRARERAQAVLRPGPR
jgi:hypothetical protein